MTGNGSNGRSGIYFAVVIAIVLLCAILIISFIPKNTPNIIEIVSPVAEPFMSPILTPVTVIFTDAPVMGKTITPTPVNDATHTKVSFPTAGPRSAVTNSPEGFKVETWKDNYVKCDPDLTHDTVSIYGVIISHGTSPYTITFWSPNEPHTSVQTAIRQVIKLDDFRDYVEFTPPFVVVKEKYTHVELTFIRKDGKMVTWIDDLLYLFPDETCH